MKRTVSVFALLIALIWLPGCKEEHQATAILKVRTNPNSADGVNASAARAQAQKMATLLSSPHTILAAVEGKRFQYWAYYEGKTANEVAALLRPRITAQVMPQTNLITLTCVHPDATLVHRIVNGIADTFVELHTTPRVVPDQETIQQLTGRIQSAAQARRRAEELLDKHGAREALRLQSDSLRQTLLTFSGKLDEVLLRLAAARPLAEQVSRAIAPEGPGLASMFDQPQLLRLPEVRRLTVELDSAEADLARLQENLAPGDAQVQAAMRRIEDARIPLLVIKETWLLGQRADFESLGEMQDSVAGMREEAAKRFKAITATLNGYDSLVYRRDRQAEREKSLRKALEDYRTKEPELLCPLEILEHAVPPRAGD